MKKILTVVAEHPKTVLAAVLIAAALGVRIGLHPTVFVRDEDGRSRFLALPVVPGLTNGGWTAVTGLPDDDDLEIVTDGAYELRLALSSPAANPAGHFHADGTFHEGTDE